MALAHSTAFWHETASFVPKTMRIAGQVFLEPVKLSDSRVFQALHTFTPNRVLAGQALYGVSQALILTSRFSCSDLPALGPAPKHLRTILAVNSASGRGCPRAKTYIEFKVDFLLVGVLWKSNSNRKLISGWNTRRYVLRGEYSTFSRA